MTFRFALPLTVALSFSGLVACKKDEASTPPAANGAASASGTTAGALTAAPSKAAGSSARAPKPLDAKQRAQLTAYQKGLSAGRKATKEARYKEAHEAFSAALAAKPGDARALSERGYAAFLGKDYDQANADLYQAAAGTDEPVLRAQIFYNLGLLREAEGLDATTAFALSNHLHPTPAAQKKLGGKPTCLVDIDRKKESSARFADWLAFHKFANADNSPADGARPPTTSEAARKELCASSRCEGAGPWIITVGDFHTQVFLVNDTRPGLSVAKVAESFSGRCLASSSAAIVERRGDLVVVRAEEQTAEMVYMCFPEKGDGHLCTDKDGEEVQHQTACTEGIKSVSHEVFDLVKGTRTLRVTHDEALDPATRPAERIQVSLEASGLALKGPGCNESLPLTR